MKPRHPFETTGLTLALGMKVRYQNNFQVKPTDVFYPNMWQPKVGRCSLTPGFRS